MRKILELNMKKYIEPTIKVKEVMTKPLMLSEASGGNEPPSEPGSTDARGLRSWGNLWDKD